MSDSDDSTDRVKRILPFFRIGRGEAAEEFVSSVDVPFGYSGFVSIACPLPTKSKDWEHAIGVFIPDEMHLDAAVFAENGKVYGARRRNGSTYFLEELRDGDGCLLQRHKDVVELTTIHFTERGMELSFYPSRDPKLRDLPQNILECHEKEIRALLVEVGVEKKGEVKDPVTQDQIKEEVSRKLEALKALEQKLNGTKKPQ